MKTVLTLIKAFQNITITICFTLTAVIILPGCKKYLPAKAPGYDIIHFSIDNEQVGNTLYTYGEGADSSKITLTVSPYADLSSLSAKIQISEGATISPASGQKVDFKSNGNRYTYLVTSKLGVKRSWYVYVNIQPLDISTLHVYKDSQITAFFERESGWTASDGGSTIPLDNGKVLWLFGDSHVNDFDAKTGTLPCLFNERNCAMLQPLNNWDWHQTSTIFNAQTGMLFSSSTISGHFNWPAAGFQSGDTAYVYCLNLKNVSGGLGFDTAGPDLFAKMKLPEMNIVGYNTLQDFKGIGFGFAFVKENDGYVYAYGNKQTFIASNVYVARFPVNSPNSNWTFWDGATWNIDINKIAVIATAPSTSVQLAKVKDKYLLFTSEFSLGCDGGKRIFVAVGSSKSGPFTKEKVIYTINDNVQGHTPFFYLPTPHPEYINNKDELLLTYSINGYGTCVPDCVNGRMDPDRYRPRGIRIPLKLIDPTL